MMTENINSEAGGPPGPGSDYVVRVTRLSVLPPKEPLFSEQCTHVTLVDGGAGEYLEIEQQSGLTDVKPQRIDVAPEEWPALKRAVDQLLADIQKQNASAEAQRGIFNDEHEEPD
jgi:hypothetical protein